MPTGKRRRSTASERPVYSVTALMAYEACPWQFYTTFVRGISAPVHPGMQRGSSVHSLIARHFRQKELLPGAVEPEVQSALDTFQQSRFAIEPVATEKRFVLPFERADVRGRIDVVLPRPGGGLEIVDFKSGGAWRREELERHLQLPLYALAVSQRFDVPPEDLAYTYYFLREGQEVTFPASEEVFAQLRERVNDMVRAIAEKRFAPAEGCTCYACEWRRRWRGGRTVTAPTKDTSVD